MLGNLCRQVSFWEKLEPPRWILSVIKSGYRIPFNATPSRAMHPNNRSALQHSQFVSQEVQDLLTRGSITEESEKPYIVSPLTVAQNSEKKRLVLDLSALNQLIPDQVFKLEDFKTLSPFLPQSHFAIKFDLKAGYHHVEIDKHFRKFLGFSWGGKWFVFNVLLFGLKTAPYLFTKILRPLVKKWRGDGLKFVLYLDDGICLAGSQVEGKAAALKMQKELYELGWVTAEKKCVWEPTKEISWLGVDIDFERRELRITQQRVQSLVLTCHSLLSEPRSSARKLAKGVGKLISIHTVVGPNTQLFSRYSSRLIADQPQWDSKMVLTHKVVGEIKLWASKIHEWNHKPFLEAQKEQIMVFSDASSRGGGAWVEIEGQAQATVTAWSREEADKSSTWRELKAVARALPSLVTFLAGTRVQWNTDNSGVVSILKKGSMNMELHDLARTVRSFCVRNNIILSARWLPREQNELADELSRKVDFDDWGISHDVFVDLQRFFGVQCTWDRFADEKNNKRPYFTAKYWVPGCKGVNAFSQNWGGHVNWTVPPPNLVARTILFLEQNPATTILVAPWWPSTNFWPKILNPHKKWERATKVGGKGTVVQGSQYTSIFNEQYAEDFIAVLFRA